MCSFENNSDYIYDVQWSPTHPAVFASVDGEGRLDFWNINTDTEVHTYIGTPYTTDSIVIGSYIE